MKGGCPHLDVFNRPSPTFAENETRNGKSYEFESGETNDTLYVPYLIELRRRHRIFSDGQV